MQDKHIHYIVGAVLAVALCVITNALVGRINRLESSVAALTDALESQVAINESFLATDGQLAAQNEALAEFVEGQAAFNDAVIRAVGINNLQ